MKTKKITKYLSILLTSTIILSSTGITYMDVDFSTIFLNVVNWHFVGGTPYTRLYQLLF